jgi:hypothetical protein
MPPTSHAHDRRLAMVPCLSCGAPPGAHHLVTCDEQFPSVRESLDRIARTLEALRLLASQTAPPEGF